MFCLKVYPNPEIFLQLLVAMVVTFLKSVFEYVHVGLGMWEYNLKCNIGTYHLQVIFSKSTLFQETKSLVLNIHFKTGSLTMNAGHIYCLCREVETQNKVKLIVCVEKFSLYRQKPLSSCMCTYMKHLSTSQSYNQAICYKALM